MKWPYCFLHGQVIWKKNKKKIKKIKPIFATHLKGHIRFSLASTLARLLCCCILWTFESVCTITHSFFFEWQPHMLQYTGHVLLSAGNIMMYPAHNCSVVSIAFNFAKHSKVISKLKIVNPVQAVHDHYRDKARVFSPTFEKTIFSVLRPTILFKYPQLIKSPVWNKHHFSPWIIVSLFKT